MLARTADNLFWLARYVERAEFTARIIDITARLAALPKAYGGGAEWESALSAVGSLERFKETYEKADEPSVIEFLIFDHWGNFAFHDLNLDEVEPKVAKPEPRSVFQP